MEPQTGQTQTKAGLGEKTRRVREQAQQKAGEQVRSGLDTGKRRAAGALHGVAESLLHGTGDDAAEGATRYIQQAGEQVRRAADWLENTDVDELTRRTEDFARRQPALFIGGAFVVGLVAARFLKSSSRDQQEKLYSNSQQFSRAPLGDVRGSGWDMGDDLDGGMHSGGHDGVRDDMSTGLGMSGGMSGGLGASGTGGTSSGSTGTGSGMGSGMGGSVSGGMGDADLNTTGYGDAASTRPPQTFRDGGV